MLWLDTALEFWAQPFGSLARTGRFAIPKKDRGRTKERKSLRDNSKAPLTRSTPKPELRAGREALSLIHILRAHDKPQSEWLNALIFDQTISEAVRQRAFQFAREWKSLLAREDKR